MRTLSVRQPYALLLVNGTKDVENRVRSTLHRGWLLIHASAQEHNIVPFLRKRYQLTQQDRVILSSIQEAESKNLFSAIIGMVKVADCVTGHPSPWAEQGVFNWVVSDAVMFDNPILGVKGRLGLWEYDSPLLKLNIETAVAQGKVNFDDICASR